LTPLALVSYNADMRRAIRPAQVGKEATTMRYITYTRDESGVLQRTHGKLSITAAQRAEDYPHAERLVGWPERTVYWTRRSGAAVGLAPAWRERAAPQPRGKIADSDIEVELQGLGPTARVYYRSRTMLDAEWADTGLQAADVAGGWTRPANVLAAVHAAIGS
jgi:hypothetical protein